MLFVYKQFLKITVFYFYFMNAWKLQFNGDLFLLRTLNRLLIPKSG